MTIREGTVEVPGGRLRYRLAGAQTGPLLVFENGGFASYEMWSWVERELSAHAQLLFYDRAGIGGSEQLAPKTVTSLSEQFVALPRALGLDGPIIAVGQSYGGLMCSLHAAQQPGALRGVVEIDPTPELPMVEQDAGLASFPALIRLVKIFLKLGMSNIFFSPTAKRLLPKPQGTAMVAASFDNPKSLDAGLEEIGMLSEIRQAISARNPQGSPRLLIGAGAMREKTFVTRLLAKDEAVRKTHEANIAYRNKRAEQNPDLEVLTLPFDHGGLVFSEAGAKASSRTILDYLGRLS